MAALLRSSVLDKAATPAVAQRPPPPPPSGPEPSPLSHVPSFSLPPAASASKKSVHGLQETQEKRRDAGGPGAGSGASAGDDHKHPEPNPAAVPATISARKPPRFIAMFCHKVRISPLCLSLCRSLFAFCSPLTPRLA